MATEGDALDGELRLVPFEGGAFVDRVATAYADILDRGYDRREILVLKRFPTGIESLTRALVEELSLLGRPNVKSVSRHAATAVTEADPDTRILSDVERIETLSMVLDGRAWRNEYFANACAHESFNRDVGRILLAATYSDGFRRSPDEPAPHADMLDELRSVRDEFHDWLDAEGWVERPAVLSTAIDALADEKVRGTIERAFDAVLAIGFEEFGPLERRYLATVSRNAELVCLAEEHASVSRVWNESGSIDEVADGLAVRRGEGLADRVPTHERVARYLATGDEGVLGGDDAVPKGDDAIPECGDAVPEDRDAVPRGSDAVPGRDEGGSIDESADDPIYVIDEATRYDQVAAIANEIGYLRAEKGWAYDEFAVLVKDSTGPIRSVRRILRRAGVPTASATVTGLGDDPAVRELHALAAALGGDRRAERERGRRIVERRMDGWPAEIVEAVEAETGVADKLGRWIVDGELKRRIAETEPIEARAQFHHVRRVRSIAEFVEAADFLPNDWTGFLRVLERAITYVASDTYAAEIDVEENGVLVDAVRLCKHDRRKAVFLVDVCEGQYPESQRLTQLFPRRWVTRMPGYPGVTTPTAADVRATFETAPDTIHDPYDAYYAELSRRQLAIGARSASDRLYFCTAEATESGTGRRRHPSRYLRDLEAREEPSVVAIGSGGAERGSYTHGAASAAVLAEPWEQLERIQGAASTASEYDLRHAERTFGGVQTLLAESDLDPRFEQAVYAQIDRALGEVGTRDE